MKSEAWSRSVTVCGSCWAFVKDVGCPAEVKLWLWKRKKSSSDAFEQVGVAVGSSAAVAQLPDPRPELHGAAVAHPTLRRDKEFITDVHALFFNKVVKRLKLYHWEEHDHGPFHRLISFDWSSSLTFNSSDLSDTRWTRVKFNHSSVFQWNN